MRHKDDLQAAVCLLPITTLFSSFVSIICAEFIKEDLAVTENRSLSLSRSLSPFFPPSFCLSIKEVVWNLGFKFQRLTENPFFFPRLCFRKRRRERVCCLVPTLAKYYSETLLKQHVSTAGLTYMDMVQIPASRARPPATLKHSMQ